MRLSLPRQGVGAADDIGDHRRIEVSADLDNEVTVETAHPAVSIVERNTLDGRRDRLEFSDGVVTGNVQVPHLEVEAVAHQRTQDGEGGIEKSLLAGIGAGQWMSALHGPGHTVGYALEEFAGGGGVGQLGEQLLAVCCHG